MRHPHPDKAHGHHTLKVQRGIVVGVHGDDVFVQLGPRAQGVISKRKFATVPREGDEFEFTLRGREESLWALDLVDEPTLPTWEDMEPGCLVAARVMRANDGGLQLKIGRLHAFLPKSQTGLPRGKKHTALVGKSFTVEVLEVDPEHQRVIVSRKTVLKRERDEQKGLGHFAAGQVVHGRVSRIEEYGVFVSLGRGREGLVHISNLAHDPPSRPEDLVALGDAIETKVLHVKNGGRRIGLGVKQLSEDPWRAVERENYEGQLVSVKVMRLTAFGAFCKLRPGVEGLLPNSESGDGRRGARGAMREGQELTVRIAGFEPRTERLTFSMMHAAGAPITADEAVAAGELSAHIERSTSGPLAQNLGALLRRAMGGDAATAI
ncbi:MAG: S1 RNA-binding domain-containing protein [Planctomycetota bacterium]|nr:S1 RNA-binding domain-containing protein [Planctomycetota bacterium]